METKGGNFWKPSLFLETKHKKLPCVCRAEEENVKKCTKQKIPNLTG
ncbi:hypothetical protein [uncultured Capnocytophaga sp.]|nr:hypothetical protein [uncultured Capnocytophaga sp.]